MSKTIVYWREKIPPLQKGHFKVIGEKGHALCEVWAPPVHVPGWNRQMKKVEVCRGLVGQLTDEREVTSL